MLWINARIWLSIPWCAVLAGFYRKIVLMENIALYASVHYRGTLEKRTIHKPNSNYMVSFKLCKRYVTTLSVSGI